MNKAETRADPDELWALMERVLQSIADGQPRILLTLATGIGRVFAGFRKHLYVERFA